MAKEQKKGIQLANLLEKKLKMNKLHGLQDLYVMVNGVQMAIRDVVAYHIHDTDMVYVVGPLQPAVKTAKQAALKRKAQREAREQAMKEHQHTAECAHGEEARSLSEEDEVDVVEDAVVEEEAAKAAPEVAITEDDIKVVVEQGGVSHEEAAKLLRENGGDPLSILMMLGK
ncbi:uncharacterized protein NEMAJ01_1674 [Nematocida major]|uniref:uncharacterized protein n=1 Tax=Nematocida major TaxID=1912982 RepID=UPI0020075ADA|nr:uncharacterized protein NEMAJ01_1674 [Nematocida major]KAH9386778.1 hypothetical protein NEMAJ01_1674 [Nematocida major]